MRIYLLPLALFVSGSAFVFSTNIINGSPGHDQIDGTEAADIIVGGAGHDTINGMGGDDIFIIEGMDNDFDVINGGDGVDTIQGSDGDDLFGLYSLGSSNSVERIDGRGGNNSIVGTGYNDKWDFLNTELINIALLDGMDGHDTIKGSQIKDVISGGKGYDTLEGNAGDDVFLFNGIGNGFDTVRGGEGFDTILGSDLNDDIGLFTLSESSSIEKVDGGKGENRILGDVYDHKWDFTGIELVNIHEINGQSGHDTIIGSASDDIIIGGEGFDSLHGGDGNDVFLIRGKSDGFDTIKGNAGFDEILGTDNDDDIGLYSLTGSSGIERIDGGAGFNRIIGYKYEHNWDFSAVELLNIHEINGQKGSDNITGSISADRIIGAEGDDTLNGHDGDDLFIVTGKENGFDAIKGGNGYDKILGSDLDDNIGLYTLTAMSGIEEIDGGAGINKIVGPKYDLNWDFTNILLSNIEKIMGGVGHDRITGSNQDDVIIGGKGYDTLAGGEGNDTFLIQGSDQGFDYISGDSGYDVILGSDGDDVFGLYTLTVESGIEKIDGVAGHNVIVGRKYDHKWDFSETELVNISSISGMGGHDTIIGSQAADTILGGDGYDSLNGGNGSDRYIINQGDDVDRISDSGLKTDIDVLIFGDTFEYGLGLAKENIWFSLDGSNLRIDVIGSNDAAIILNWKPSSPVIERIETKQDSLHFNEINNLVVAMSEFSAPEGEGAELSSEMKTILYPVISSAWNLGSGTDSDGDGVEDSLDAFPYDPNETFDTDGDGVGDNSDAFVHNAAASIDTDNDGAPDTWNSGCDQICQDTSPLEIDAFPNDSSEWLDTDGDGTGNNSDSDSDNDGFSDEVEISKGTDPLDSSSFPQPVSAQITIHTLTGQTVSSKEFEFSGVVVKGDLEIAKLYITNIETSENFILVLNNDGTFTAQVSLNKGINQYRVTVEDVSDQIVSALFNVTYQSDLSLVSVQPKSKTEVGTSTVDLSVEVQAGTQPTLRINNSPLAMTEKSGSNYTFSSTLPLSPGINYLSLNIVDGNDQVNEVIEFFYRPSDMSLYPKPELSLVSPDNQTRTSSAELPLQVTVHSNVGGLKAVLNGAPASVQEINENVYLIQKPIVLVDGNNHFELIVEDALNQSETLAFDIEQDTTAPEIHFDDYYSAPPVVNALPSTRFDLIGRILAGDISTVTVNGKQAELTLINTGEYEFEHPLLIAANQDYLVSVVATDSLGNANEKSLYFSSNNNLNMEWVTPAFPAQWIVESGTEKPFAIKLIEPSGNESYQITLNSQQGNELIQFNQLDTLLTGTLPSLNAKGTYTIKVQAFENGKSITQLEGRLSLISQDDISIKVSSVMPAREAKQQEPDTFLQVNFNRPVDPNKIEIVARRTLHGLTYINTDSSGVDFLHAKGSQLSQVNIDRELVAGSISILPDDSSFVFYPEEDLGYTAEIDWQVKYDGQVLSKQRFKTRDLPTIIEGGVKDSLNQTLSGISVELEELGYVTQTNSDGGYSFGYGLSAEDNIPNGRYHLLINKSYTFPKMGEIRIPIDIIGGKRNRLSLVRIPNLSSEIQWIAAPNGVSNINLAQGDLKLNLRGSDLLFPGQNRSIHSQFIPASAVVREVYPGTIPLWFYQLQPFGMTPTGPVDLEIKAPLLRGTLDYLGAFEEKPVYAFVLGYSQKKDVIEPVGVVEIISGVMKTLEPVTLENLDYIGYGHVKYEYQEQFKQFKNHEISFVELVAQLTVD